MSEYRMGQGVTFYFLLLWKEYLFNIQSPIALKYSKIIWNYTHEAKEEKFSYEHDEVN